MVQKSVAIFWCVVLFATSALIFWSGAADSSWLMSGLGYLSGFLAFGALLQLFKKAARGEGPTLPDSRDSLAKSGELTREQQAILGSPTKLHDMIAIPPDSMEILGVYGNTLAEHPGFLKPISALPYPKETIRHAIETALRHASDPAIRKDLQSVLVALDDFVPDDQVPRDYEQNVKAWLEHRGGRPQ